VELASAPVRGERHGMNPALALFALPLILFALPGPTGGDAPPACPLPHPHFQKQLECRLSAAVTVTVRYQTVTFDREGAAKMKPGAAWHLAGATFATTGDLLVGGQKVAPGEYALSARKTADGGFELTLHEGRGFSLPKGDAVLALATTLDRESLLYEHMNIDVQPAGDKEHTLLQLEVRFDRMWARARIELPE
jgi:hypothetical protein